MWVSSPLSSILARSSSLVLLVLFAAGSVGSRPAVAATAEAPRLLVTVVVDGLGTEQMVRHRDCYGDDGFERILTRGTWMREGRLAHATTWTAPSHGSIATGSSPERHGLVGNSWFDRDVGRSRYCMEDSGHEYLGEDTPSSHGTSPGNMLVPALADVLHERSGGRSRTLAVSIKDRGAITGAGRHGKAFFYSRRTGRFVSSTFYYDRYPQWWHDYYADAPQDRWFGEAIGLDGCGEKPWHALHEASLELVEDGDDPRHHPLRELGEGAEGPGRVYYDQLRHTPQGDAAILDFARAAVVAEGLGTTEGVTDQLFVSLSCLDYASHDWGPDSPQASAIVLGLDRELARLFAFLDDRVGEDRWVVALTADHGFPSTPEVYRVAGESTGRHDAARLLEAVEEALDARYGPADWIRDWSVPSIYLDLDLVAAKGIDASEAQEIARAALLDLDGVLEVFTRDFLGGSAPADELGRSARLAWHPERSGELMVMQDPHWYLHTDPYGMAATHGSPHDYDRRVPVAFVGAGVPARTSDAPAHPRDIAPTLLGLVGMRSDPGMQGRVLPEIVQEAPQR